MNFDVFISHATEDKDDFVRELAEKLQERRIEVWYDEHSLNIGDSLRQSIDLGLSKCRFGIVVLSKNFFNKQWANWELDGLVQRQLNSKNNNLIIPIWYKIEKEDILEYSPSLTDKVAIKAAIGLDKVVDKIDKIINPKGSTLIVARDYMISKGFEPPMLTDDWWLDVLEYPGDTVLENDYLKFHIDWSGFEPSARGEYIGKNALQMLWRINAQRYNISQLSTPNKVINFINSQPGLKDFCLEQPYRTARFFPQLTIKGMGNFMENVFNEIYAESSRNTEYTCIEEIALRDEKFGKYDALMIAGSYFTGDGISGLSTRLYEHMDYIIWLLSDSSKWLPISINKTLLKGLCEWAEWPWQHINYEDYTDNETTGNLSTYLFRLRNNPNIKMPDNAWEDLLNRIHVTIEILELAESKEELAKRFMKEKIINTWLNSKFIQKKIDSHLID